MKIITAREADKLHVESLFNPGGTLVVGRFDKGKYRGKPSDYIGREVPDVSGVVAVYPFAGRDSEGPYVGLRSLSRREVQA